MDLLMTGAINHKSILASFVLLVMMGGLALIPFQVQATVPTIDFVAIGKLILQLAEQIFQSGQLSALVVKEYVLDPAVKLLASIMLQAITKSIISWIQSGGNENFVSNLQAAMNRAADEAAGEFLSMLAGTNLCSPFANPLRGLFKRPYLTIADRLSCRVTDIFKNLQTSYEEFLADFRNGGWIAYEGTLTYGGNNYIDALIQAYDIKLRGESQRIAVVHNQYQAGQGFLGVRVKKEDCSEYDPETGQPLCITVDVQTTPGTLAADQLKKAFGSGIDQAVNTDEIAEAIDAIITALINKLIDSAIAGLADNNESSGIYDPGFTNFAPAPLPPPPPPPEQATIKTDIQRVDGAVTRDIDPTVASANSVLPQITTSLNRIATSSASFTHPDAVRLREVRNEISNATAALGSVKDRLNAMKKELESVDQKIAVILDNPNAIPVENLAALYARSRQISQDITTEINDGVNPRVTKIQGLVNEAQTLIPAVNQLPI